MTENTAHKNKYLCPQQCENLKLYRYAADDRGLAYIYFFNPVCNWWVNFFPMWLAPNTITLIGFFFSVAPGIILFSKYGTSFENGDTPIDSWFFYFYAVCYFVYRMCDEVDGKQARRTKNSSALGMLFDHGCDAYGVNLHILNIMKCL